MVRFWCGLFPSCGGYFHAGSSHGEKRQVWSLCLSFFFFKKLKKRWFGHDVRRMGSQIPNLGSNLCPLAVEAQSLNHWSTREVPLLFLIGHYIMIDLFSRWQNLITSQKPHLWILGCQGVHSGYGKIWTNVLANPMSSSWMLGFQHMNFWRMQFSP